MQKLIIFDCDGVLVDSEALAARVFSEQLYREGIHFSPEQCFHTFKGYTLPHCLELLQNQGYRLDEQFIARLGEATTKAFDRNLQPVSGITQVLNRLNQLNVPFCVASNGGLAKVKHSLKCTGLSNYFGERCFSAEMVDKGKPEPDLFLHAAKTMGHRPAQCIVVEDSVSGVLAANRAGMMVKYYSERNVGPETDEFLKFTPFEAMEHLIHLLGVEDEG